MIDKITNILIAAIFIWAVYWFVWGRVLTIKTNSQQLNSIINLTCFENIRPNMSRSQISRILGQPTLLQAESDGGTIWTYERTKGALIYHTPVEDNCKGVLEFIPKNNTSNDFLLQSNSDLLKNEVEIVIDDTTSITMTLANFSFALTNKVVEKIEWSND